MDINNFLLFKQGLLNRSDLEKNSAIGNKFFKENKKVEIETVPNNIDPAEEQMNKLREIEDTCPTVKKVREFIKDQVEEINDEYDF